MLSTFVLAVFLVMAKHGANEMPVTAIARSADLPGTLT
jgi:hypothetical protein